MTKQDNMGTTEFIIINDWTEEVSVYLTLDQGEDYISNINKMPFIKNVIHPLQGYFTLAPSKFIAYTPPKGEVLSGNIAFNSPPLSCPTDDFPMGINLAEFTLNSYTSNPKGWETVDISNVSGANSYMKFLLTDGDKWNAGPNHPDVIKFKNGPLGENIGNIGVYPYACDICTASVAPPYCDRKPLGAPAIPIPQTKPICNIQRASSDAGGTVSLFYLGPIMNEMT
ncbi:hypothetical protein [Roseivirga echinicomitans]|uniref:Uncharacterized protein n=1 Tax=Roseivirga echinicomitans TaxID=296218 RepID=A0A150XVM1_9BACT|nr:hypothetical protein [Roseivirga echinicomitans]KYG82807.1 hypothetical protein AWN68_13545 [Roseivirga echinicomitans]